MTRASQKLRQGQSEHMGAPSDFITTVAKYKGKDLTLGPKWGLPPVRHRFDEESLNAIFAALAAERPLLVRGEPGTGKSQLARAAAEVLGRAFIWRVVDAQTQVSDLFYTFDAISRLARAQVVGPLLAGAKDPVTGEAGMLDVRALLDERNFVAPGPLWWAFARRRRDGGTSAIACTARRALRRLKVTSLAKTRTRTAPSRPTAKTNSRQARSC
ncbi:MAG TPA: AAA family ATPase [Nannocystaceae bacterium]|nr:AAA family ATPase [Nannocystaceae bacterium]